MIYTSYFSNWRNFPEGFKLVSISCHNPDGATKYFKARPLNPPYWLLKAYKYDGLTEDEYIKHYTKEVLSKLNPEKMKKHLDNSILLCYEKKGDFCHRNLILEWLNENGIEAEEL